MLWPPSLILHRTSVSSGPRFLECYDDVSRHDDDEGVAAGPRFLKCYDAAVRFMWGVVVAAGPRFLKCYDYGNAKVYDYASCSWTAISELLLRSRSCV